VSDLLAPAWHAAGPSSPRTGVPVRDAAKLCVMPGMDDWRARAQQISDDLLFPASAEVDAAELVPRAQLDTLAADGFYGIAAPVTEGGVGPEARVLDGADDGAGDGAGVGVADGIAVMSDVVATLAGGCLATAFVWLQHLGPVMSVAASPVPGITRAWLGPLARGERRAGVALAGVRPGPAQVQVEKVDGGYLLRGETAWVTGWGLIDTLHLAARDFHDVIHFLLLDAIASPTLEVGRTRLMAAQASGTVTVRFDDHFVAADRLTRTQPLGEWAGADSFGSSLNGFLALGVARRAAWLLETDRWDDDIAGCRTALLTAAPGGIPAARARTSRLAVRIATELMVRTGSRAVLAGDHAQRLYREAGFLLVFGSRPAIRDELLGMLG